MAGGAWTDMWALCHREVQQFYRRPMRIAMLLFQPLIFLFLYGFIIQAALTRTMAGVPYVQFIVPGVVAQRLLSNASRGGMGLIRDRSSGFLKEVLVAPVARWAAIFGLSLGTVIRGTIQGALLLVVGIVLGLRFGGGWMAFANFLAVIAIMMLMGLALVLISFAIAWKMDDVQNFALATGAVTTPLFIFSGSLYSITSVPGWLKIAGLISPVTYGIDAMRYFAVGHSAATLASTYGLWLDLLVVGAFFAVTVTACMLVIRSRAAD